MEARGGDTAAQAIGAGDAVARILQALDGKSLTISVSAEDCADQALEVNPKAGGYGQSPTRARLPRTTLRGHIRGGDLPSNGGFRS